MGCGGNKGRSKAKGTRETRARANKPTTQGKETYSRHLQKAVLSDHNLPSQPKENSLGQNRHQEETIHQLAMQLKNIGDSVDHWMAQENLQREGREALAYIVVVFRAGGHALLRFLWYIHWM